MTDELKDITIAVLATDGVEQSELQKPRDALEKVGAKTVLISLGLGDIKAWNEEDFGDTFPVDLIVTQAAVEDFDALLLPGGVISPDKLRNDPVAVSFVRDFFTARKPVAAICHGPQTLINAEVVKGRTLTSYSSIKVDLINAGAFWIDRPVVVDVDLVTSRCPADIPEFNERMIEVFREHAQIAPRLLRKHHYAQ